MKELLYVSTTTGTDECRVCGLSDRYRMVLPIPGDYMLVCANCLMHMVEQGKLAILYDENGGLNSISHRTEDNVKCTNCESIVTSTEECDECRPTCDECESLSPGETRVCHTCYENKETGCNQCGNTDIDSCDSCHECQCNNCGEPADECANCIHCYQCGKTLNEFEKEEAFICPDCREDSEDSPPASKSVTFDGVTNDGNTSRIGEIEVAW